MTRLREAKVLCDLRYQLAFLEWSQPVRIFAPSGPVLLRVLETIVASTVPLGLCNSTQQGGCTVILKVVGEKRYRVDNVSTLLRCAAFAG